MYYFALFPYRIIFTTIKFSHKFAVSTMTLKSGIFPYISISFERANSKLKQEHIHLI